MRKLVERRPGLEKDGFLEAVTVFTDYLFGEGWERVQASTAVDNVSMRRLLERAAYGFEGVLRQFGPGVDGREDYAMYAATRGDRGAARG
ncbi:MAG: GNAT family N-acetyltransferase [Nocardioidaceae bacterium]